MSYERVMSRETHVEVMSHSGVSVNLLPETHQKSTRFGKINDESKQMIPWQEPIKLYKNDGQTRYTIDTLSCRAILRPSHVKFS